MGNVLHTTVVGSYSVPEWYAVLADSVERGLSTPELFTEAKAWAARAAIKDQELAGIDVVSDGELFRRDDNRFGPPNAMINHFAAKIPGFSGELRDRTGVTPVAPDAKIPAPVVVSALDPVPLGLEAELGFLRETTERPVRIALTGPHMFATVAWDEHYGSREALADAMTEILNAEVRRLDASGCDVIQIDEPILWFLSEDRAWALNCVNRCFAGVSHARRALHLCQGNYNADPAFHVGVRIFPSRFEAIVPVLEQADVDEILLAFSGLGVSDIAPLREFPSGKAYGVGAIDVQTHDVETADAVAATIDRIAGSLDADLLVVPDCGLNHLPRNVAFAKLQALAAGAALAAGRAPVEAEAFA